MFALQFIAEVIIWGSQARAARTAPRPSSGAGHLGAEVGSWSARSATGAGRLRRPVRGRAQPAAGGFPVRDIAGRPRFTRSIVGPRTGSGSPEAAIHAPGHGIDLSHSGGSAGYLIRAFATLCRHAPSFLRLSAISYRPLVDSRPSCLALPSTPESRLPTHDFRAVTIGWKNPVSSGSCQWIPARANPAWRSAATRSGGRSAR